MKIAVTYLLFFLMLVELMPACNVGTRERQSAKDIIVEADVSKYFYWPLNGLFALKETVNIQYSPFYYLTSVPDVEVASGKVVDGNIRWVLLAAGGIRVAPPLGIPIVLHPGDSLHVQYLDNLPVYWTNNTRLSEMLNRVMKLEAQIPRLRKANSFNVNTLADYREWDSSLDSRLTECLPVIDSYKGLIADTLYNYYRSYVISKAENERVTAFSSLRDSVQKGYPGLTLDGLVRLWDSTQNKVGRQWLLSNADYYGSMNDLHAFNRMEVWRRFRFNFEADSLKSKEMRTYLYYTNAKAISKGVTRERLLAFILDESTITEMGLANQMTRKILQDYYSQPHLPEYLAHVKELERVAAKDSANR